MRKFIVVLLVIAFCLPDKFAHAQSVNTYPFYTIQPGDSLGYIADIFDTTVNEIINLNKLTNPDLISPGQVLQIPSLAGYGGNIEIIYTELGESYSLLPIIHGMDEEIFTQINKILSPSQIYVGTKLIILKSDDSPIITPLAKIEQDFTIIETAIEYAVNPYSLSLINNKSDPLGFLENEILFSQKGSSSISLDLFAPELLDVSLYPLPLVQGGTAAIAVDTKHSVNLSGSIGEFPLIFFSEEPGKYFALQGIHALAEPGLVEFSLKVSDQDGIEHNYAQQVLITPGLFDEDPPLTVDPATIDPSITDPENELVFELISQRSPIRYWSSGFKSPAYYQEYNSLFGTRRKYNDDPKIYFHTGVDFAGGLTLPITAPAAGRVVFSGPLTVRGNAVFIDHGWGVYSGFFHQDTIVVKVGDIVESGQQIGTVGNTGRVNGAGDYYGAGAHLHWEIWVNGVQVDPLDWLSREYP